MSKTTKQPAKAKAPSKKAQMIAFLKRPEGASVQQLMDAIRWQQHSVRGALVHLKNRDRMNVTSAVVDGTRRYSLPS